MSTKPGTEGAQSIQLTEDGADGDEAKAVFLGAAPTTPKGLQHGHLSRGFQDPRPREFPSAAASTGPRRPRILSFLPATH